MEAYENLLARRACRAYKSDMPSRELIEKVVQAGLYAPSGMGRQSAEVFVITDPALRNKVAAMNAQICSAPSDTFYGAPVILLVAARSDVPTAVYDGSLMLGNMANAAAALGLATCWIHRAAQEIDSPLGREILEKAGVPAGMTGVGHLALGYAAAPSGEAAPRREGRVHWL